MNEALERILELERVVYPMAMPTPYMDQHFPAVFLPVQRVCLEVLSQTPAPYGLVVDAPVGAGKAGISLCAHLVIGAKRPVLLVPSSMKRSTARILDQGSRFQPPWKELVPALVDRSPTILGHADMSKKGAKKGKGLAAIGGTDILNYLQPDCIVIDEAHAFTRVDSSRTRRLFQYMDEHPNTRLILLSGTLLDRDCDRFMTLIAHALRERSPFPTFGEFDLARMYVSTLNRGSVPDTGMMRALRPLGAFTDRRVGDTVLLPNGRTWEVVQGVGQLYAGFRERWQTAPHVVTVSGSSCAASLQLYRVSGSLPEAIKKALEDLRNTWTLPDGSELVDALEMHRHAETLSLGFFYDLRWTPEQKADGTRDAWMEARRNWGGALRNFLRYSSRPGLDSPALVEEAIQEGRMDGDLARLYNTWIELRETVRPPENHTIWIDRAFLAEKVAAWMKEHTGPIWYSSARALEPVFREMDIQVYGAGAQPELADATRCAALSIEAHGTGKNLQFWADMLVLQPSPDPKRMEQLLGRSHRPGQDSEEVRTYFATWAWPLARRLDSAIEGAAEFRAKTGQNQKLLYADWPDEES